MQHARCRTRPTVTALHLLALWALAVAGPLYEVLRRNREFFVAHRTTPADLLLFVLVVSVVQPGLVVLLVYGFGRVRRQAGRAVLLASIALLGAALASEVLAGTTRPATIPHLTVAVATGIA